MERWFRLVFFLSTAGIPVCLRLEGFFLVGGNFSMVSLGSCFWESRLLWVLEKGKLDERKISYEHFTEGL